MTHIIMAAAMFVSLSRSGAQLTAVAPPDAAEHYQMGSETFSSISSLVRRSNVGVRITSPTNVVSHVTVRLTSGPDEGQADELVLPIRIENCSSKTITAMITHEWGGGIPPRTDLEASATRLDVPRAALQEESVYLSREAEGEEELTVWRPGQSHIFMLRMNWPGTGSQISEPLIATKAEGKFLVKVLLLFRARGPLKYIESPAFQVEIKEPISSQRR